LQLLGDDAGRQPVAFRKSFSRIFYLCLLFAGMILGLQYIVGLMFVSTASGIVHSGLSQIGADVDGRVLEICVQEGVPVKKDTLLARIAVPGGDAAVRLASATATRLQAQIQAEHQRAVARGRQEASRLLEVVGDRRDRSLTARAELLATGVLIESHDAQIREIKKSIAALDRLNEQEIQAEHSYLDLRVQKLALEGKRDSLSKRCLVLESRIQQLVLEMQRLSKAAAAAENDAIEASRVALLEAELVEAKAQLELQRTLAIRRVTAPEDGKVSWFQLRTGEVVVVGDPVLQFVPDRPATVVVYPGKQLESFPERSQVHVIGAGFRAMGTVVDVSVADRERPISLLKPYQKSVVGPAILVRIDEVKHGTIRAGAEVKVSRAPVNLLHWFGR
jgi:multidrug resistance efflux pump